MRIREATGAGPIMLGDLAERMTRISRDFSTYSKMISQVFENPYVDNEIDTIDKNLKLLAQKVRRGDIVMTPIASEEYEIFKRTIGSLNMLVGTAVQNYPDMVVLHEALIKILDELQEIFKGLVSRIGVASTKASGVVDIAMFADLLMLLQEVANYSAEKSGPNDPSVKLLMKLPEELYNNIMSGLSVSEADMELRKVHRVFSTAVPMDPYESGLVSGIMAAVMEIVQDLGLDQEPPMGNLPPVRKRLPPEDYNE